MLKFNISLDKISLCVFLRFIDVKYNIAAELYTMKMMFENDEWSVKEWESPRDFTYRTNYAFKRGDSSIYFGYSFRSSIEKYQDELCKIEWNPNKTEIPLKFVKWLEKHNVKYCNVDKCDFAFDFLDVYPSQFRIATRCDVMYFGAQSNLSKYIRPKSNHLRIKIYDKSKESGITYAQITRVEITLKKPDFHECTVMNGKQFEYVDKIVEALSDVYVPKPTKEAVADLVEKYGPYNESICYMLDRLQPDEQHNAIALMQKNTRAKYRAYLKRGFYESFWIDQISLSIEMSKCLNRTIKQLISSYEEVKGEF